MGAYIAKQISEIINAQSQLYQPDSSIEELVTDTRKIRNATTSLFFAITATRDGHHYVDDAYRAGVRNFVISKKTDEFSQFGDANFFRVENTTEALQKLAAEHRKKFKLPVIGITGSNGKTIIKEWLYQLLKNDYTICRSPKSYNSQIGVPLSVWQLEEHHTLGIFEAGISTKNEMWQLQKIINPTIGIFTNLGDAHNEGFADKREKTEEKARLFRDCEKVVYCEDNYWVLEAIDDLMVQNPKLKTIAWSLKNPQCPFFAATEKKGKSTSITLTLTQDNKTDTIVFSIPFTDNGSVENAIHCAVTMFALGKKIKPVTERFAELTPVEMRLQLKKGVRGCDIINDAYNNDLNSLNIALDFLKTQKQHGHTTVILSDISQSGMPPKALYAKVSQWLAENNINRFIGIGSEISNHSKLFAPNSLFFEDTKEFLNQYNFSHLANTTILVKGGRSFGFEKIIRRLEDKNHETVLEINLTAIAQNLNFFRGLLAPTTKIMAMVKANSYGSGSYEIANILQFHGADYLAVAYADEGIELRKKGITLPIMVMNPAIGQFAEMLEYYLEPEIYNFTVLEDFITAVEESTQTQAAIHLEFDTGMHRLGFEEQDIAHLVDTLKQNEKIRVASVFSHLAASDEAEHDGFTQEQIDKFKNIKNKLQPKLGSDTLFHICNSSGITRFKQAHFNMVRLGIGLYGIDASGEYQKSLQTVFRFKSTVSQIREINANESVGYSRKGLSNQKRKIAVVALGYADGLRRELSNGKGKIKINGQWAAIVGNVCMDMCMVDVTNIDCQVGDEAIIFETNAEIIAFAQNQNTIPYEVLTSLNQRVKRVYWQE